MPRSKSPLREMLKWARKVPEAVVGYTYEDFLNDEYRQLAVSKLVELVGEAAGRLLKAMPDFAEKHPEIPFAKIIGTRNVYVHNYEDIDLEEVWEVATQSIPALIAQLELLAPPEEGE